MRFDIENDKDLLTAWASQPNASGWLKNLINESLKPKKMPESEPRLKAEIVPGVSTAAPPASLDTKDELSDAELDRFIASQLEKEKDDTNPKEKEGAQRTPDSAQARGLPSTPAPAEILPPNFFCENGHPIGYFNLLANFAELIGKVEKCPSCGSTRGDFK